jgi:hypothetical protein
MPKFSQGVRVRRLAIRCGRRQTGCLAATTAKCATQAAAHDDFHPPSQNEKATGLAVAFSPFGVGQEPLDSMTQVLARLPSSPTASVMT